MNNSTPRFTKKQWGEIYAVRSRLEAFKNKIQPYPAYPDEIQEPKPQVVEHIVRHSNMGNKEFDLLQQTALKVSYLDQKLTEHLEYKTKPSVKSSGRGIQIE